MLIDNAVIMAAGTSSRFAPLSYEKPKALIEVKGEILIERQIKQIYEAGIDEVFVITGYMADKFEYLTEKYGVKLIYNPYYLTRNNNASIWMARDVIKNTYICSADNYFSINPFEKDVDGAYYSGVFANGHTDEWCMKEDSQGFICSVEIGGENSWYMLGHAFWSEEFSKRFLRILEREYEFPDTYDKLWENIFVQHIDTLKMRIRKYSANEIYEFDTLDELREFDDSYKYDSRSLILKRIARNLSIPEGEIQGLKTVKGNDTSAIGFDFKVKDNRYRYSYAKESYELIK